MEVVTVGRATVPDGRTKQRVFNFRVWDQAFVSAILTAWLALVRLRGIMWLVVGVSKNDKVHLLATNRAIVGTTGR